MAIRDLQQRARELGRIRIGQTVQTKSGKTRPAKLDRFRLTSASRPLLEAVAALYGGEVVDWQPQGGGPAAYEVVTNATRLPVMVPPQPVSQFYELWSGGGCRRRCDSQIEMISGEACICGPDPAERACSPTTRLNVVLRDVPGVGVWRLESHGYNAAVELPQAAMFLAQAGGYVNGYLALEARRSKREIDGKIETRDFIVPILEIDVTPTELMAGKATVAAPEITRDRPTAQLDAAETRAIEASAPAPVPDYAAEAEAATTLDEVRAIWGRADAAGHLTDELKAALIPIGNRLGEAEQAAAAAQAGGDPEQTPRSDDAGVTPATPAAAPSAEPIDAEIVDDGDTDEEWRQLVLLAGEKKISLPDLDQQFEEWTSGRLTTATAKAADLRAFRELIEAQK